MFGIDFASTPLVFSGAILLISVIGTIVTVRNSVDRKTIQSQKGFIDILEKDLRKLKDDSEAQLIQLHDENVELRESIEELKKDLIAIQYENVRLKAEKEQLVPFNELFERTRAEINRSLTEDKEWGKGLAESINLKLDSLRSELLAMMLIPIPKRKRYLDQVGVDLTVKSK